LIACFIGLSPLAWAVTTWNETLPGTTNISDIDARVSENYAALEALLAMSSFKGLKVTRPSVSTVTVVADDVVVQEASDLSALATSVSVTCDITVSGANGLDASTENSSTWYYVYVIQKSSDWTKGCLLSTSSTAPTMPSGYDQSKLVSAVRNNGSSDLVSFYQFGRDYFYDDYSSLIATGSPSSSFADIDCSTAIPPISTFGKFNAKSLQNNGALTTTTLYFRPNGSSATGTVIFQMTDGHGSGGQGFGAYFEMPTDSSQIIEYMSETQQRGVYIAAVGFTLNI
jgi:hypothetical protein